MRLLEHVALRCGTGNMVLDAVKKRMTKKDAHPGTNENQSASSNADVDVTNDLEGHVSDIYTALDATSLLSTSVLVESVR